MVDGAILERLCTERYRGFESPSLRSFYKKILRFFYKMNLSFCFAKTQRLLYFCTYWKITKFITLHYSYFWVYFSKGSLNESRSYARRTFELRQVRKEATVDRCCLCRRPPRLFQRAFFICKWFFNLNKKSVPLNFCQKYTSFYF